MTTRLIAAPTVSVEGANLEDGPPVHAREPEGSPRPALDGPRRAIAIALCIAMFSDDQAMLADGLSEATLHSPPSLTNRPVNHDQRLASSATMLRQQAARQVASTFDATHAVADARIDAAGPREPWRARCVAESLSARHTDAARSPALGPVPTPTAKRPSRNAGIALSAREREVLRLIVDGRTDRAIAAELSLSYRTVTTYVTSVLTKLDLPSRTAAAVYAIRHGLA
jgi:DNA-binding CsgD family transcriptional regulator